MTEESIAAATSQAFQPNADPESVNSASHHQHLHSSSLPPSHLTTRRPSSQQSHPTMTSNFWFKSAKILMTLEVLRSATIITVVALMALRCRIYTASFMLIDAMVNIFVVALLMSTLLNAGRRRRDASGRNCAKSVPINNILPYMILKVLEIIGYVAMFFVTLFYQKFLAELLCQYRQTMLSQRLGVADDMDPQLIFPDEYVRKIANQMVIASAVVCIFGVMCTSYLLFVAQKLRGALVNDSNNINVIAANRQLSSLTNGFSSSFEEKLESGNLPPKYDDVVKVPPSDDEILNDLPSYELALSISKEQSSIPQEAVQQINEQQETVQPINEQQETVQPINEQQKTVPSINEQDNN